MSGHDFDSARLMQFAFADLNWILEATEAADNADMTDASARLGLCAAMGIA